MRRLTETRGTAALELVLLAPVLLVLVAAIAGTGRVVQTKSALGTVAREAARAGAEATTAREAHAAARRMARMTANGLGLNADRIRLRLSAGGFPRGGTYTARIAYRVRLRDLPSMGALPDGFTVRATHAEPIHRYKSR